jgi:hypothetical protein
MTTLCEKQAAPTIVESFQDLKARCTSKCMGALTEMERTSSCSTRYEARM